MYLTGYEFFHFQTDTLKLNPLRLMIPCTIACSFAFMLPVATINNAIVYSYGRLNMGDMVGSNDLAPHFPKTFISRFQLYKKWHVVNRIVQILDSSIY